jgi:hypothetical protein
MRAEVLGTSQGRERQSSNSIFKARKAKRMRHHLKHLRGKGVALKPYSAPPRRSTIISESIPSSHRSSRDWTNERGRSAGARLGPHVEALIDVILSSRPYPEHGFRFAVLSQSPSCRASMPTRPYLSPDPQKHSSLRTILGTRRR